MPLLSVLHQFFILMTRCIILLYKLINHICGGDYFSFKKNKKIKKDNIIKKLILYAFMLFVFSVSVFEASRKIIGGLYENI